MMPGGLSNHPEAGSFSRGLQERHLDELGFLLGHRVGQLRLGRWSGTPKTERRMAGHLGAIAAHGRPALDAAAEAIASDDASLRAGAAYALAALGDASHRGTLLGDPKTATDDVTVSALALAPAPAFTSDLEGRIATAGEEPIALLAATILGRRRETSLERMIELAATVDSHAVLATLALALARMGSRGVWPVLYAAARRNPKDARLLLGMAIANDPEGLRLARALLARPDGPLAAPDRKALVRAVGIAGDAGDLALLASYAKEAPLDVLPSLGLLGFAEAVPGILPYLESKEEGARRAAGFALETLTGAALEAVAPPEVTDEAAVDGDADPMAALEISALPVCTDPVAWRAFWNANAGRFSDRRKRYRRGQAWSPAVSLDALGTLPLSLAQRQLEADELSARTGLPTLEADWSVSRQEQHLARSRTALHL